MWSPGVSTDHYTGGYLQIVTLGATYRSLHWGVPTDRYTGGYLQITTLGVPTDHYTGGTYRSLHWGYYRSLHWGYLQIITLGDTYRSLHLGYLHIITLGGTTDHYTGGYLQIITLGGTYRSSHWGVPTDHYYTGGLGAVEYVSNGHFILGIPWLLMVTLRMNVIRSFKDGRYI